MVLRRLVPAAALLGVSACVVLTDLEGFSDGRGSADASPPGVDASADGALEDAVVPSPDGGGPLDAAPDAPKVPTCKGTRGPKPINIGTYCVDATEVRISDYEEFLAAKAGDTSG